MIILTLVNMESSHLVIFSTSDKFITSYVHVCTIFPDFSHFESLAFSKVGGGGGGLDKPYKKQSNRISLVNFSKVQNLVTTFQKSATIFAKK